MAKNSVAIGRADVRSGVLPAQSRLRGNDGTRGRSAFSGDCRQGSQPSLVLRACAGMTAKRWNDQVFPKARAACSRIFASIAARPFERVGERCFDKPMASM